MRNAALKNATVSFLLLALLGVGFVAGSWHSQRERVNAESLRVADVPSIHADRGHGGHAGMHGDHTMAGAASSPPSAAAGAVSISPDRQQLIGVRVSTVENGSATGRLRLYGRVAPDETRLYILNVGIDGFVRQLSNVTTGSHVRQDDWLATLSAPEARLPIQGYLVALDVLDRAKKAGDGAAALEQASAGVQQSLDRLLTLGMPSVQIDEIARTRVVPPSIRVTAPTDGFVLSRNLSAGQKLERGDELFRIADLRRVWILADVFGREADYVRPGMIATVSLPDRAHTLRAAVSGDVLPQFDRASQSLKVRLEVENPQFLLRPDMFVDVELPIAFAAGIAVPAESVLDSGVKTIVFVERGAGVFAPREVETGWRSAGLVEIVHGLSAGDRIVVSGTFLLDSESRLRARAPGMSSHP
jgi:membrane fusion protein, copper/silver efflux system